MNYTTYSAGSSYAQDSAPEISFSLSGLVTSTAGVFDITGTSVDDTGIVLNRLYVRNLITGQFWDGTDWVDTWSWFDLAGLTDWSYSIDLDYGTYSVFAWAWDQANQRTRTSELQIVVAAEDTTPPEISFNPIEQVQNSTTAFEVHLKSKIIVPSNNCRVVDVKHSNLLIDRH